MLSLFFIFIFQVTLVYKEDDVVGVLEIFKSKKNN